MNNSIIPELKSKRCLVTGAGGLCGRRLVEMLCERGAEKIVAFDLSPRPEDLKLPSGTELCWVQGDLSNADDIDRAVGQGVDCVWHLGALTGPFFAEELYRSVNYEACLHLVASCQKHSVKKIVMASSPSARIDGKSDICWRREEEVPLLNPGEFMVPYAETKAMGERAVLDANDGEKLLTVVISPHQAYGPGDQLFLGNLIRAAKGLRIFGSGENLNSMVYVDNYCHGLILGDAALFTGSVASGKSYIVTDDEPAQLWRVIDRVITEVTGVNSLFERTRIPAWLAMGIGHVCQTINRVFGTSLRLSPFTVKMLMIERTFDISNAKNDLGYRPLVSREEALEKTIAWYKQHPETWSH